MLTQLWFLGLYSIVVHGGYGCPQMKTRNYEIIQLYRRKKNVQTHRQSSSGLHIALLSQALRQPEITFRTTWCVTWGAGGSVILKTRGFRICTLL